MNAHACCHGGDEMTGMTTDPVCGMSVDPATSKHRSTHDGRTFHFCGGGCKAKFDAAPSAHLGGGHGGAGDCCAAKPVLQVPAAHDHHGHAHHEHHDHAHARTVKDPVCGMDVDPLTTKHRAEHDGHAYHFCSARCREKFVADPPAWLEGRPAPPAAPPGTVYPRGAILAPLYPKTTSYDVTGVMVTLYQR